MLAFFRNLAGTWPARIFFVALAAAFVGWGVSNRASFSGTTNDVATVDGNPIPASLFQFEFQQEMKRVAARFPDPAQMPPGLRQGVANQALERLVTQQAIDDEVHRMGLAVSDAARDRAVYDMPAFKGLDGKFDRNIFLQVLAQNSLTEPHFLQEERKDLVKQQLLQTIQASAQPSDMLTGLVYAYLGETRRADLVVLPFSGRTPPAAPADAVLHRFYDNNPARYTAPEYRHIKVVILSPATIGRTLPAAEADLHTWYDAHHTEFEHPETRSIQVITASTRAAADTLAAKWSAGATWDAMQAAAKAAGASTATLDDTTRQGVPSPELGAAAFAAAAGTVAGPVAEPLGFQILKVTRLVPAVHPTFDSLRDTVRTRVGAEKAADLIDARSQKLQDLFAGGARIDEVPADLGAAGAEGTLDAQGNTPTGETAPLPAPPALRTALIADAFKVGKGDAIQLTEGPDHAWYAVAVDSITKPAAKPYDQVRAAVLADWQHDQIRRTQEAEAAKLLALVRGGQSLTAAAWGSGLQVARSEPLHRNQPTREVPAELAQTIFTLKPGEGTMVETNAGFVVAALATIDKPDPATDKMEFDRVRGELGQALSDDYLVSYGTALRDQSNPRINAKLVDQLVTQTGE